MLLEELALDVMAQTRSNTGTAAPGELRVGADLVAVDEVAEAVDRFGDRYLERVYTAHELACCQGAPQVRAAGLAARFAAKEAALKVLRPTGAAPDWRSIEVRRQPGGWCALRLTGTARRLADEAGIRRLSVSLSHQDTTAGAVVVAW